MKRAILLLVCMASVFVLHLEASAVNSSKFIFIAPRTLTMGKEEQFSLHVLENPQNLDFKIRLVRSQITTQIIPRAEPKVHNFDFYVGITDDSTAILEIVAGNSDDAQTFRSNVTITRERKLIFIETNQLIYKPGELVRFRILLLEIVKLLPVAERLSEVFIEDPDFNKVARWENVQLNNGFAELEFQLKENIIEEGFWDIQIRTSEESHGAIIKHFEVRKKVLPKKFKITLEPPTIIKASDIKDTTWKVCARNVFGGPVRGDATIVFSVMKPIRGSGRNSGGTLSTVLENTTKQLRNEDGCYDFVLVKDLWKDSEIVEKGGIIAKVYVEEKSSGHKQSIKEITRYFDFNKIQMKFNRLPKYYYPFIPYHGEVLLSQGGEPLPNRSVELKSFRQGDVGKIIAVTDQAGRLPFTIYTGKSTDEISFRAKLMDESEDKNDHIQFSDHLVTPWFSKTNSYISISSPDEVACDGTVSAEISYTFPNITENSDIQFEYLVQSVGDLVHIGRQNVKVKSESLNSDSWPNIISKADVSAEEQLLIGKWTLNLKIEPHWSPLIKIVIYYLRDGKEIVSSNKNIEVKGGCFRNAVSSRFTVKKAKPGQNVTLSVTTSSKSLCAFSGIDKAFVDPNTALTVDQIRSGLKYYDVKPNFFSAWDYKTEDCKPEIKKHTPSIISKRSIRRGTFDVAFGNAKKAFEDGGFVILSTLDHNIKPCRYGEPKEICDICPTKDSNSFFTEDDSAGESLEDTAILGNFARPPLTPTLGPAEDIIVATDVSNSPQTWLWQLEEINGNTTKNLELETPRSVTNWILNTICVSSTEGLGIAPETSLPVIN
ncbi:alpha-2-macroglobulin-like [Neocloeon triangulifer]|uniref:alpha-2-macroglobulin-like n=1 Tax=Neocloeon triangulifer TaxID=2078957 RepID=UPI00286F5A10|nr:alpha-2-macroglobulin-like [Neocloeon triangulifer]XP_059488870.1 alpha-2-macroglobulin-like [Neocloeon triangulifer]